MALTAGTRLGPYEIRSALGAGGMGEVYRARDTKLNRDVAIKVLLSAVASDPDRLARFSREAQVLAALNHQNIAHIHGLEDWEGTGALVMELVEGPTLADRIAQGPIPIEEAAAIARQIADALEAAHEQGIIHRDLKPANIKVRPDGTVKVLDFGLAKALEHGGAPATNATMSPTLSIHGTQAGIILGTAAYMSPEQAAGRPVDKRSDLWSFGVVLLEMLTGKAVFSGETVSHVLAAVLKTEPDWTALPPETPPSIRRLLRRCLEKDRKRRLESAADARLEVDEASMAATENVGAVAPVSGIGRHAAVLTTVALLLFAGGVAATSWMMRAPSTELRQNRLTIATRPAEAPGTTAPDPDLAVSLDGRRVVYVSRTAGFAAQVYVRALDQLEPTLLRGLPASVRSPFLSPDGAWVGFVDGSVALMKVAITGGSAVPICVISDSTRGASWGAKNTVIFATIEPDTGLLEVSADGGESRVLTRPDAANGEVDHYFPEILPGGDAVLFTIVTNEAVANSKIAVLDLRTGKYHVLLSGGSNPRYSSSGHIVYGVGGTLRAIAFDIESLQVRGPQVAVVEPVVMKLSGAASFGLARDGSLIYLAGDAQSPARSLVWVDRKGVEKDVPAPPRGYVFPRVSPDGTMVATEVRDEGINIYIWTLGGQTFTPLTTEPGAKQFPVWTPKGDRVVYTAGSPRQLFSRAADGTGKAEPLGGTGMPFSASSYAPDGSLVVNTGIGVNAGEDLYLLSPSGGESRKLLGTSFRETNGEVSPDGRFLAYQSDESGAFEVHVRPFPDATRHHWQVSKGGGTAPLWAHSGRELFYRDADGKVMSVPVAPGPTFSAGNPSVAVDRAYFVLAPFGRNYDISPDDTQFLMIKDPPRTTAAPRLDVWINFAEELKRLVPTK